MDTSALFTPAGGQQFLLAFTRIGSLFLPLGIPGTSQAPAVARVALGAIITLSLWPQWLHAPLTPDPLWGFLTEAGFGVLAGLTAGAVLEGLQLALQMIGLQSGYQYASTIDPNSQADSAVLPVLGQLFGYGLFFALRGDHLLIRVLARSFREWPPGAIPVGHLTVAGIARAGTLMLDTALGFALPLIALLLLIDLALGVVTRAHAQLQLISIAFPVKMLLAMFTIVALLPAWTKLFTTKMSAIEQGLRSLLTAG
jgi:flagellar biosynthesis protein FliR